MRYLLATAAVLVLTACGSDAVAPGSLLGAWNLSTIDGKALPVNLLPASGSSCGLDVRSGQYTLEDGGKYSGVESYGYVSNGVLYCNASTIENGTYTVSGSTVTLRDGVQTRTLTIAGDALTRTREGHLYVYRR